VGLVVALVADLPDGGLVHHDHLHGLVALHADLLLGSLGFPGALRVREHHLHHDGHDLLQAQLDRHPSRDLRLVHLVQHEPGLRQRESELQPHECVLRLPVPDLEHQLQS